MLKFENQQDFVEIDIVSQEDDLRSEGDAYVKIRIFSAGFSGHNDLWILAPDLQLFYKNLIILERDRRGQALLTSASPDELNLTIRSVDSSGHMMVEGLTGYGVQCEHTRPWHAVHFGFEFDPSQLLKAVHTEWVKRNARS